MAPTIESVLAQHFSDFELSVIDDNSPDETDTIVLGYSDARIRYLKNHRNLGPEGNWNRCLVETRGRYFKLVPQDDLLYPDIVQRQVEVLERDEERQIALVFGSRNIIDAIDKVVAKRGYLGGHQGMIPANTQVRRCVRFGTNLFDEPASVLMRKSLADQVGGFDGSIGYIIDLDYWVRLLAHGGAYCQEEPVSAFRVSSGSWRVAIGNRQSVEYRRFIARLCIQPNWRIGNLDRLGGNLMARLNNVIRLAFYRFVPHHYALLACLHLKRNNMNIIEFKPVTCAVHPGSKEHDA